MIIRGRFIADAPYLAAHLRSAHFQGLVWLLADTGAVSQGKTIEEAQANLKEAVELYLESFGTEDLPESTGAVVLYFLEVAASG